MGAHNAAGDAIADPHGKMYRTTRFWQALLIRKNRAKLGPRSFRENQICLTKEWVRAAS